MGSSRPQVAGHQHHTQPRSARVGLSSSRDSGLSKLTSREQHPGHTCSSLLEGEERDIRLEEEAWGEGDREISFPSTMGH